MRIVVLTPSLPLRTSSTDARWLAAILPELARRGHEILCLACTERPVDEIAAAAQRAREHGFAFEHVRLRIEEPLPLRKLRSALRPRSELARVPELRDALGRALERPADVLHVEHLHTAWAALEQANLVCYLHYLSTIDAADDPLSADGVQASRATTRLLRSIDRLVACTPRLEAAAVEINPTLRAATAPIVIEPDLYAPVEEVREPIAGLIGSMHWGPSRSAAVRLLTRIWPEVRRRLPQARLLVGGWNAECHLGTFLPIEGVELVQGIREPRDFFSRIGLLIYPPLRGSGVKVKTLEAMAFGVPVLTNAEGLEGIEHVEGATAVRAESDEDFVERSVELLVNPERRAEIAAAGRALVEREHSPAVGVDRLLAAYDRVL